MAFGKIQISKVLYSRLAPVVGMAGEYTNTDLAVYHFWYGTALALMAEVLLLADCFGFPHNAPNKVIYSALLAGVGVGLFAVGANLVRESIGSLLKMSRPAKTTIDDMVG